MSSVVEPTSILTTPPAVAAPVRTLADLIGQLGEIPLNRIAAVPPPGYATELDLIHRNEVGDGLFELEHGVLIEKIMGQFESFLAAYIASELHFFLRSHDLGKVYGSDGPFRILPGVVKMPDVSFVSWSNLPLDNSVGKAILETVPNLVVEVISKGNTRAEMQHKLVMYFKAGVQVVWYIDPASRTAESFRSLTDAVPVDETGWLEGDPVLPGFRLSLSQMFSEADRRNPKT